VRLLGERTAALHRCLASDRDDIDFAPEPFNPFLLRSQFQSMRNLCVQSLGMLKLKVKSVPDNLRADVDKVVALQPAILDRLRRVMTLRAAGKRIRVHGDYHLGQVLHTGKDFLIIDFEGEPARSLGERRLKRTPLTDVAGMLRSFDYAAHAALFAQSERGLANAENLRWIAPFLPTTSDAVTILLEANLINKALYEMRYELNNRPAWLPIPVRGLLHLLQPEATDTTPRSKAKPVELAAV
jgi:maltose alpha-D-glucosyltransferase/alpha-amylase